jgi:hypothetical protein
MELRRTKRTSWRRRADISRAHCDLAYRVRHRALARAARLWRTGPESFRSPASTGPIVGHAAYSRGFQNLYAFFFRSSVISASARSRSAAAASGCPWANASLK